MSNHSQAAVGGFVEGKVEMSRMRGSSVANQMNRDFSVVTSQLIVNLQSRFTILSFKEINKMRITVKLTGKIEDWAAVNISTYTIAVSCSHPAGTIGAIAISKRGVEEAESEISSKTINIETGIDWAKNKIIRDKKKEENILFEGTKVEGLASNFTSAGGVRVIGMIGVVRGDAGAGEIEERC